MAPIRDILAKVFSYPASHSGMLALARHAQLNHIPTATKIFASGDDCESFVVVTKGVVRVQLCTKTGREVVLFRIRPKETCALTTSCLLTNSSYYAEGITETAVELLTIPAPIFQNIYRDHPEIFATLLPIYANRIHDLTGIVDRLISRNLPAELWEFLQIHRDQQGVVKLSHQTIADEIGSSREVISRKLKVMERKGLITLERKNITILAKHG